MERKVDRTYKERRENESRKGDEKAGGRRRWDENEEREERRQGKRNGMGRDMEQSS